MSTNTKLAEAARRLDDAIKDLPDGCEGWLEPLDERIAELRAALAAHDAEQAQASKAVPALYVGLIERLMRLSTRLGIAYEGGVEHFAASLEDRLYAICRGAESLLNSVATPPAPEAQQPAGRASVDDWERELSAAMPADFKDWWQNSPIEWPAVAAAVIKSLRLDRDAGWEVAARAQRRERLTDGQLSALLKEARKIIRASSSRSLAKDWDRRATQALAGATTGKEPGNV